MGGVALALREPSRRVSEPAVSYWRVQAAGGRGGAVAVAAAGIVAAFLLPADWWAPLLWVGALLCVFVAVGWVAVTPQLGEALAVEVVTRLVAITAATPEDAT